MQYFARLQGGDESIFADDLNIFQRFDRNIGDEVIFSTMHRTADDIHEWGTLNRVIFDPAKEAFSILHPRENNGDEFMSSAVERIFPSTSIPR